MELYLSHSDRFNIAHVIKSACRSPEFGRIWNIEKEHEESEMHFEVLHMFF